AKPLVGEVTTIYLHSNGVHTDFILPQAAVPERLIDLLRGADAATYLAFGWGDKGFYLDTPTWADLKASTALKAMLIPSPTAMHATNYRAEGKEWVAVPIGADQLETLLDYIENTFEKDAEGNFIFITDAGYGDNDNFYEAYGNYNGIQTCNYWINKGLKKMDIRTSVWSPFDYGLLYHARREAEARGVTEPLKEPVKE
ncbi:MAG: TIGR02117 family protein, partial [Saprospiraceae bacterium]